MLLFKPRLNRVFLCTLKHTFFNKTKKNILIYSILLILFTTEVLIYYLNTFSWYQIPCKIESKCTRILLVADPQIIGLRNEHVHWLTPITIWDCDRYLAKTFQYAFYASTPDVVVFLGDQFDEGSTGSNADFKTYSRRFLNIFVRPFKDVQHIWLPGDNDIGGEGTDLVTEEKFMRFESVFSQPDVIQNKHVQFYKVNEMIGRVPTPLEYKSFSNVNTITVALSHMPLLMAPTNFANKVLDKIHPHLLFTAHRHQSMVVTVPEEYRLSRLITPVRSDESKLHEFLLGITDIYEILVPTCSYRMGTATIGYGFAVIESNELRYTVLWSPSRFPQLILYASVAIIAFVNLVLYCVCYSFCRREKQALTLD